MNRIIIIGGGASGLVTAINAKNKDNEVIVLEKNNECAKKILATGNGRCNYMNDSFDITHYNSSNIDILNNIITKDNKLKILNFFDSLGIVSKIKNGYYYPSSNQALTIQNILIKKALSMGIIIYNDIQITSIKKDNNEFNIQTNIKKFICNKLVLATGSKAGVVSKLNYNGYDFVRYFGHSIINPLPALTGLKGDFQCLKDWNGVRTDVNVSLIENDNIIKEESGEIQLTDYGISGICIFQLSSKISRGLYNSYKEQVMIDFLPFINCKNYSEFKNYIDDRNEKLNGFSVLELFEGILNNKLTKVLLKCSCVNLNSSWNNLSNEYKRNIYHNFKKFIFNVKSTNSFEKAQVCSGGVPLTEININTMKSLVCDNLYIIGELLDVDGECGGYNLSFAWLSGILCGENIND